MEANYRGKGKWYPGRVKQARSDGTFDINYDDGESETRVDPDLVRAIGGGSTLLRSESLPRASQCGWARETRWEANFRVRGKWYPGRISSDRVDGTYDVAYDDGESEMRVGAELIRSKALEGSLRMSAEQKPRIEEGSKVEANYGGKGKWYPGRVRQIRSDGTFDINYDDGESETRVDPDLVRAIGGAGTGGLARSPVRAVVVRISEGDKVEANYRGKGKWYPGRVKQARSDGHLRHQLR